MNSQELSFAKKTRLAVITFLIVGGGLAITLPFTRRSVIKSIKAHPKFTRGIIQNACYGKYSSNDYDYTFTVNNKNYSGKYHVSLNPLGIGAIFPVVYDSLDPSNINAMLVEPADYKSFGFSYDSVLNLPSINTTQ